MTRRILITGAAGLVGQNLILQLRSDRPGDSIIAIDKHRGNLELLARLNDGVETIWADLAERGDWEQRFVGIDTAIVLHAQITGKTREPFVRNNLTASEHVFRAIRDATVPFTIHVSSSVVNSIAHDHYSDTKKLQEQMFRRSGIPGCVLRPTLMFGWFDPKHFGWLARFMERAPVFPIPGNGRYMRQPLYERDFCRAILWCIEQRPAGSTYDLVGNERIDYIDVIRSIRRVKRVRTPIVNLPYGVFAFLLQAYGMLSREPPFTVEQLRALTAGDDFKGVDIEATFGFRPTPFLDAIRETFCDARYSGVVVERT